MACDESLYRQYLNGDDEGLNALMKKYGVGVERIPNTTTFRAMEWQVQTETKTC